ncbi:hypothetical protein Tco_0606932 [Tanacetum coccineum]
MASTSNRREKAKTSQPWTTAEEITLCTAWCNAMDKYGTRDMKKGFWSELNLKMAMDKKTTQSNPSTSEKPPMPPISSFYAGGSSSQEHTHQPMSPISSYPTVEESAEEHEICDLTERYLTKKEQQQLLLDKEALRETLEEQAMAEKEWEEFVKQ